jgi:AcrR family transcriptional regulator
MKQIGPGRESSRSRILRGAVECFENLGLARTTMEDVAAAAGVSRKTVYNAFRNKGELIADVVDTEMRRVLDEASLKIDLSLPPDELIATAEVLILQSGKDSRFVAIILGPDSVGLALDVTADNEHFTDMVTDYWRPVLDNLEERAVLRTDVSRSQIMRWILSAHFMLISRTDTFTDDPRTTTEMVRLFLAPSILAGDRGAGSIRSRAADQ